MRQTIHDVLGSKSQLTTVYNERNKILAVTSCTCTVRYGVALAQSGAIRQLDVIPMLSGITPRRPQPHKARTAYSRCIASC